MAGPIKPKEVQERKNASLPEEVFTAFNDLITENWSGKSATFTQEEAINRIVSALNITRKTVFDRSYLDVEDAYRKAGWKVEYDKPGFNETYEANFTFRK